MRLLLLAALVVAASASTASSSDVVRGLGISSVEVTLGPALQAKAKIYGQRELDDLARDLRRDVQGALRRAGSVGLGGARLELVIADATPNRPTFKELGDRVGLSPQSVSVGGARIEGRLVYPDGQDVPVRYAWYETDLRNERASGTWSDASRTFQVFADGIAHGKLLASR